MISRISIFIPNMFQTTVLNPFDILKYFPPPPPIWQDQISRLSKENGSLKQNLEATKAAMNVSRSESAKALLNGVNVHEVLDL